MRVIHFHHSEVPTPNGFTHPSELPSLPERLLQGVTREHTGDPKAALQETNVHGTCIHFRDIHRGMGYPINPLVSSLKERGTQYACFVNDVGSAQSVQPTDTRLTTLFSENLTKFDSGKVLVTDRSQLLQQMTQFKQSAPGQPPVAAWAVLQAIIIPSTETMSITVHMLWTHQSIGTHNTTATLYCTRNGQKIEYIHDVFAPFQATVTERA